MTHSLFCTFSPHSFRPFLSILFQFHTAKGRRRTINPNLEMKVDKRMCRSGNKNNTLIKKKKNNTALISSSTPFRRARTKIKKPKFLSLSNAQLQMVEANKQHQQQRQPKQLELFPICQDEHEKEEEEEAEVEPSSESMADHMFPEDGPTLNGLLNGAVSCTTSGVSYATAVQDSVNSARSLVRTAMRRSRERDEESEEKWVSISEVVERRRLEVEVEVAEEEVTSGGGGGLWLKLDYEEVLNTWSGKRPFYVEAEEDEQTVPELRFGQYGGVPFWGVRDNGYWSVPENSFNVQSNGNLQTDEEKWKLGLREASVLRYKEKRQSRLFSKRIRYEVRKLNAEKRPRIKGRFVKRCENS